MLINRKAILVALPFLILIALAGCPSKDTRKDPKVAGPPGTYLFCFWNVENLYDDHDDPKIHDEMEDWFGQNPDKFRLKIDRLADVLTQMNGGIGPDVFACCEVENDRCLNALKDALNARINKQGKAEHYYQHVLFVGDNSGRDFAPGILTRLPITADRTHKFAKHPNGRNIEGHIVVNGHELIVLAAHWTSRVDRGKNETGEPANAHRRMSYAKDCYGRVNTILTANAEADIILCGDFNDTFGDPSIRDGLHAVANAHECRDAPEPRPLNLLAGWKPNNDPPGSIYYKAWSVFDHICVTRGLLDNKGWSCDSSSASIFATKEMRKTGKRSHGEPFRFGDGKSAEHGYADHFPVTVRISVTGGEGN
jgi:endonuclease/exonuclease/phosphatase family metal-dependent hydrolase